MAVTLPAVIVAEISKNWSKQTASDTHDYGDWVPVTQGPLLSQLFEHVIEANRQRGYQLVTFDVSRVVTEPGELNETIIAVFQRVVMP